MPTCGCPVNATEADHKQYPCPCGSHCKVCKVNIKLKTNFWGHLKGTQGTLKIDRDGFHYLKLPGSHRAYVDPQQDAYLWEMIQ